MGRGVLLHTYITYGERLGATRGLHIHSRDFKPSGVVSRLVSRVCFLVLFFLSCVPRRT